MSSFNSSSPNHSTSKHRPPRKPNSDNEEVSKFRIAGQHMSFFVTFQDYNRPSPCNNQVWRAMCPGCLVSTNISFRQLSPKKPYPVKSFLGLFACRKVWETPTVFRASDAHLAWARWLLRAGRSTIPRRRPVRLLTTATTTSTSTKPKPEDVHL